jgi:hypothetical protein
MSGSLSGVVNVVVAVGVVALVLVRQVRPRQVSEGGRWLVLPGVLVVLGLQHGGVLDPHHQALSAALLAAGIVVGAGTGVVWAFTSRIWRDENGTAWTRGTKATAAAWVGGIALRIGMAVLGGMMGVHEGQGATMLALAATLLVRKGVLAWRVGTVAPRPLQVGAAR